MDFRQGLAQGSAATIGFAVWEDKGEQHSLLGDTNANWTGSYGAAADLLNATTPMSLPPRSTNWTH